MDVEHRRQLAESLIILAEEAGKRIMRVYQRDFAVETKTDASPLTEADRAAHEHILTRLRELTPTLPVLSEEGGLPDYDSRRQWPLYWLVDPLDGTKEFIKKNGEFTVNIALVEQGQPVLGIVHAPVLKTTYIGNRGDGAWRISDGARTPLHTRALPNGSLTLVVSRSHRGEAVDRLLERLPPHETRSVGSSLKFCLVAEGKADLYPRFGPTSEWDTAAAQCVVEAAGGRVTRVDLRPLTYNAKASLLNPDFLVFGDPNWELRPLLTDFEVQVR
ncbi:MAG: 3'(2'),5'-bisphosphate nucleotidase CysQ [Nitrococcus mobilis]|nr:3'(2'),5'-bisphosphate nucleotidase CysQ [Nitrococcus mobilis]